jgi:hypothetical protein
VLGCLLLLSAAFGGDSELQAQGMPSYTVEQITAVGQPTPVGGTFEIFGTGTINESGALVFDADLSGDFDLVQDGIFLYDGNQLQVVATVGDPLPGGGAITSLARPAIGNSGAVVFNIQAGIVLWRNGVLDDVVRVGQATPVGGTFTSVQLLSTGPGSINAHDHVVFRGSVSGGSTSAGVFVKDTAGLRTIATVGAPTPGRRTKSI